MDIQDWIDEQNHLMDRFYSFWIDMNAHWPSAFPMSKDDVKWAIEFERWVRKGMPSFEPKGSEYFN